MSKKSKPKLILVHGWGLNSAIWQPIIEPLSEKYQVQAINLPGYGDKTACYSPKSLELLAERLLNEIEVSEMNNAAHWCAWSLGGMAAIQAALKSPEYFQSLSLVCTTAKFVKAKDWPMGVDMQTFQLFADQLKTDYDTGIRQFLLLQAGAGAKARSLAKSAAELLSQYSHPSAETLESGLDILRTADLREQIASLNPKIPCQIISGKRDRVIHPDSGKALSQLIPHSSFSLLNSGHAPHLSHTDEFLFALNDFIKTRSS